MIGRARTGTAIAGWMVAALGLLSACSSATPGPAAGSSTFPAAAQTTTTERPTTTTASSAAVSTTTGPSSTVSATAVSPTVAPATAAPATVVPATTVPATTVATTTTLPTTTPYGMPVANGQRAGYSHEHHDYPASDVFAGGCGSSIISPVNGTILETRRVDGWVASVDNPATRGGKSISILGDDGVRYYLAHLDSIDDVIQPGVQVTIGQSLGLMGRTGKAGACHLHFAISPPCPAKEWAVRRGVIWPWRYLDAWRNGEQFSPVAEIEQWVADHPTACAEAIADPNAGES